MFKKFLALLSFLFFPLFPSAPQTQCNDQQCRNLQAIFNEAAMDFRGYRAEKNRLPVPDVSIEGAAVPCQISLWANNVPMFICSATVPVVDAQKWYVQTLQSLQALNPAWHFQISSSGEDHYVDAGPPQSDKSNCEVPPNDGPRLGDCPLHLRTTKQSDGTAKLYLLVNSFSSPYLLKPAPSPPSSSPAKAVSSAAGSAAAPTSDRAGRTGCDEFCQNLKKVFEARADAFANIRSAAGSGVKENTKGNAQETANGDAGENYGSVEAAVKLPGAKQCGIKEAPASKSGGPGTQFVCYWRESSASSAEEKFRDLIGRLEVLIPSNWSTHQEKETDDSTGAERTAWYATEPGAKHEVRLYVSAESLALHITARN